MKSIMTVLFAILIMLTGRASAQDQSPDDPKKLNLYLGSGVVSSKSKINPLLPHKDVTLLVFGSDWTDKRSEIKFDGQLANHGLMRSKSFRLNSRTNLFTVKGIGFGIGTNYFYALEIDPLIRGDGLTADSITRKHYGVFGVDALYGNLGKRYIRGGYMVGAAYLQKDGLFLFSNPDVTLTKLYDKDLQSIDIFKVSGAWTKLWRFDVSGSASLIRTREFKGYLNTKEFMPLSHTLFEASVKTPIWKFISLSANTSFSNDNDGAIFLGNSATLRLGFGF